MKLLRWTLTLVTRDAAPVIPALLAVAAAACGSPGSPGADGQPGAPGYLYPGKQFAAQRTLTAPVGVIEIHAVVLSDTQGAVKTGSYVLGMRKVP